MVLKKDNLVKLKVMEALQEDAYKGIARVDNETMKLINAHPGDIVIIKGERETVAILDRAYPADVGEQIIRIDGITRKNAKTGIGEFISLEKTEVKEAKKIGIAPAQKGIRIQADSESLRRGLLGRVGLVGDLVVLGGVRKRMDLMSEEMGGDLNDIFGEMFKGMGFGANMFGGGVTPIKFLIVSSAPKEPIIITENTEVVLNTKAVEINDDKIPDITYEDIGGLDEETNKIREMVELPLKHPEVFEILGVEPPRGVLLHGPPGTGKTLLAKAVASETDANFILLNGPEIMSKFYGESEKNLREKFEQAEKNAPSIIFIDELDAIAPKREDVQGEVERRVVSQLLTMMDGLKNRGKIVVIGATNRPNAIDEALRRPGRFDREIAINVPDKKGRLSILKIHTRNMPLTKNVKLDELAARTHGFVGADISALCKEAAMNVLRKNMSKLNLKEDQPLSQEDSEKLVISQKDFEDALKTVRPSAMREVLVEKPNIKWEDIGGLDKIKQELKEAVEWPLKFPEAFSNIGIRAPRGLLIYGPPGTGKTLLAKAVANESEANFIQVKGPELLSKWVGESEKGVRKIFARARQVTPCIIFFDEIDALASKRGSHIGSGVTESVLNQLLAEMDGLEELKDIVVLAATNRPDMLDSALLRPGRFDRIIGAQLPTKEGRLEIFEIHTNKMPLTKDVSLVFFAEKTEGYTGADIESVCREAGMLALREDIKAKQVKKKHFVEAMAKIGPSVTKEDERKYRDIEKNYLRSARAALKESHDYTG